MKILYVDIETSPYVAEIFDLKGAYVRPEQILEPSEMLCFAAQWDHEPDKMRFYSSYHHGKDRMVLEAWRLLDEADVVVHYYGKRFDKPRLYQEFLLAGYGPPSPFQEVDLWETVKRFGFNSSSLGNVLNRLNLTGKVKHEGQSLWHGCRQNDPRAWSKMRKYNKGDVSALRELWHRLGPWIKNAPNVALYMEDGLGKVRCTYCGSEDLQKRGYRYRKTAAYQQYRCNKCGGWLTDTSRAFGTKTVSEVV